MEEKGEGANTERLLDVRLARGPTITAILYRRKVNAAKVYILYIFTYERIRRGPDI